MREGQRERKCNKSFHDSVAFIKSLQITVKSIQKVVERRLRGETISNKRGDKWKEQTEKMLNRYFNWTVIQ